MVNAPTTVSAAMGEEATLNSSLFLKCTPTVDDLVTCDDVPTDNELTRVFGRVGPSQDDAKQCFVAGVRSGTGEKATRCLIVLYFVLAGRKDNS